MNDGLKAKYMFRHYLRVAFRNLGKNKKFSAINIIGLTIGLTCCLLMALYITHELSYDRFQTKGDRIVRVIMEYSMSGSTQKGNFTSTKVAPAFQKNFPEVEAGVRMSDPDRIVRYGDKFFNEKSFLYVDSTFFSMFSFPLLKGNPNYALSGPNKIVFTESSAKKYFGDEDPVGKTVKIGSSEDQYLVTGITKDCPANSQFKFDFIASFSSLNANQETSYWDANYTTYLLLRDKSSIASLQSKIPGFMKKETAEMFAGTNNYISFELEPLQKVHFSDYGAFSPNNSITYIYIIGAVALLILAIACFTYINLSTARSMERAKEVGIRKVTGALKKQIFWQFIGESVLITCISLLLSIALVALLLPGFNTLAERSLTFSSLLSPYIIGFAAFTILCISFLAGSYPAFILSGFQPVRVLKGAFKNTGSGLLLRKSLIVFQFVISAFLIIATFIIQNQLHYIQNKKLGFDRDHIVVLPLDGKLMDKITTIKSELKTIPDVISVAKSHNEPVEIMSGYTMYGAQMDEKQAVPVNANIVDEDFIGTIGAQIITGVNFTRQDINDMLVGGQDKKRYHFILNESAAKALGWTPEQAISKKMVLSGRTGIVKAVVKDFHFLSFHEAIRPLVLFSEPWCNYMLVKLSGRQLPQTISAMAAKWKAFAPHRPFEYRFLDDDYNKLYSAEMRLGKVLNLFAAIAVLLAAMGLFGLSAFAIQQRTKEIGIRKVLGASAGNIAVLVSNQFIKLVLIALVIASPFAWIVMNKWLEDFAYRIHISWWMFALTGGFAVLIAIITVSFQVIRAAISNPVKSLRTE